MTNSDVSVGEFSNESILPTLRPSSNDCDGYVLRYGIALVSSIYRIHDPLVRNDEKYSPGNIVQIRLVHGRSRERRANFRHLRAPELGLRKKIEDVRRGKSEFFETFFERVGNYVAHTARVSFELPRKIRKSSRKKHGGVRSLRRTRLPCRFPERFEPFRPERPERAGRSILLP